MPNEIKYLGSNNYRLNSDDAAFALLETDVINAENVRTQTTDGDVTAVVGSVGSNVLLSTPQPSVVFITIGTATDIDGGRIFKFQYNTNGTQHKIQCLF